MIDEIKLLFGKHSTDRLEFKPEIKVRREKDIIYISELVQTKETLRAKVEVGDGGDKASMPIGLLDDKSLRSIWRRLQPEEKIR